MARWDPGTEQRLAQAALALFRERGYSEVTVTDIAERAGITRRTYFRYFPDKREVLFANSDRLVAAVGEAVLAAGAQVSAFDAALSAFTLAGNYLTEHIAHAVERLEVIRASPDLRERERTKHAALSTEIERALVTRGTASGVAHVIAQVTTLAFVNAYEQSAEARDHRDFADHLQSAVIAIRSALDNQHLPAGTEHGQGSRTAGDHGRRR